VNKEFEKTITQMTPTVNRQMQKIKIQPNILFTQKTYQEACINGNKDVFCAQIKALKNGQVLQNHNQNGLPDIANNLNQLCENGFSPLCNVIREFSGDIDMHIVFMLANGATYNKNSKEEIKQIILRRQEKNKGNIISGIYEACLPLLVMDGLVSDTTDLEKTKLEFYEGILKEKENETKTEETYRVLYRAEEIEKLFQNIEFGNKKNQDLMQCSENIKTSLNETFANNTSFDALFIPVICNLMGCAKCWHDALMEVLESRRHSNSRLNSCDQYYYDRMCQFYLAALNLCEQYLDDLSNQPKMYTDFISKINNAIADLRGLEKKSKTIEKANPEVLRKYELLQRKINNTEFLDDLSKKTIAWINEGKETKNDFNIIKPKKKKIMKKNIKTQEAAQIIDGFNQIQSEANYQRLLKNVNEAIKNFGRLPDKIPLDEKKKFNLDLEFFQKIEPNTDEAIGKWIYALLLPSNMPFYQLLQSSLGKLHRDDLAEFLSNPLYIEDFIFDEPQYPIEMIIDDMIEDPSDEKSRAHLEKIHFCLKIGINFENINKDLNLINHLTQGLLKAAKNHPTFAHDIFHTFRLLCMHGLDVNISFMQKMFDPNTKIEKHWLNFIRSLRIVYRQATERRECIIELNQLAKFEEVQKLVSLERCLNNLLKQYKLWTHEDEYIDLDIQDSKKVKEFIKEKMQLILLVASQLVFENQDPIKKALSEETKPCAVAMAIRDQINLIEYFLNKNHNTSEEDEIVLDGIKNLLKKPFTKKLNITLSQKDMLCISEFSPSAVKDQCEFNNALCEYLKTRYEAYEKIYTENDHSNINLNTILESEIIRSDKKTHSLEKHLLEDERDCVRSFVKKVDDVPKLDKSQVRFVRNTFNVVFLFAESWQKMKKTVSENSGSPESNGDVSTNNQEISAAIERKVELAFCLLFDAIEYMFAKPNLNIQNIQTIHHLFFKLYENNSNHQSTFIKNRLEQYYLAFRHEKLKKFKSECEDYLSGDIKIKFKKMGLNFVSSNFDGIQLLNAALKSSADEFEIQMAKAYADLPENEFQALIKLGLKNGGKRTQLIHAINENHEDDQRAEKIGLLLSLYPEYPANVRDLILGENKSSISVTHLFAMQLDIKKDIEITKEFQTKIKLGETPFNSIKKRNDLKLILTLAERCSRLRELESVILSMLQDNAVSYLECLQNSIPLMYLTAKIWFENSKDLSENIFFNTSVSREYCQRLFNFKIAGMLYLAEQAEHNHKLSRYECPQTIINAIQQANDLMNEIPTHEKNFLNNSQTDPNTPFQTQSKDLQEKLNIFLKHHKRKNFQFGNADELSNGQKDTIKSTAIKPKENEKIEKTSVIASFTQFFKRENMVRVESPKLTKVSDEIVNGEIQTETKTKEKNGNKNKSKPKPENQRSKRKITPAQRFGQGYATGSSSTRSTNTATNTATSTSRNPAGRHN